ncbi:lysozyme [Dickeya zeae]|uniref:lysozyme n=1 Tax=Dickeya zeae TaxID=204042 RepID=UPI0003A79FBD|nr:lysozyme [Dickeya zeae]UUE08745.1 lysozyme [Dickeya zeae]
MAQTIDELLISLGLKMDAKSFQAANDAIKGVSDKVLQLAAVAGTGMGLRALTSGVAQTALEMKRVADNTGFTIRQIQGLEMAMNRLKINPEAAQDIAKMIPALQLKARFGQLGDKAYWGAAFNPTEFASMDAMNGLKYFINAYSKMNYDQRTFLRQGAETGQDSPLIRLSEKGSGFLDESMKMAGNMPFPIDNELLKNAQVFNDEMAQFKNNLDALAISLGKGIIPVVNDLLKVTNRFIQENPGAAKGMLTVAGVGSVVAGSGMLKWLLRPTPPKGPVPTASRGLLSRLLFNPLTLEAAAAFTPGNIFTSTDEARAMSNPLLNRGGSGGGVSPYDVYLLQQSGTPRGIRNNNPGNLNFAGQAGALPEPGANGRFAVFPSMDAGLSALHRQLQLYGQRGKQTVSDIIKTYAPASDNNDTAGYIRTVSSKLGISPNQPLDFNDKGVMARLMKAIVDQENGGGFVSLENISSVISGGSIGQYLPDYMYRAATPPSVIPQAQQTGRGDTIINQQNEFHISGAGLNEQQMKDAAAAAIGETAKRWQQSYVLGR